MDKKVLVRLLQHRVKELEAVLTSIDMSEKVHQIDVDIFLSKIRIIYDDVKLLSQSKAVEEVPSESIAEQVFVSNEKPKPEPKPEPKLEAKPEAKPESKPEPEPKPEPKPEPEPVRELIVEPIPEPEPIKEPAPEDIAPELVIEPAAKPEEEMEELASKPKATLLEEPKEQILTSTKMQAIDDIMVAIGLNDRFLFIRELFDNDSDLFKNTIQTLNQKGSWEEAGDYLAENFTWNTEDPTLILFLSFVKRRFI